jgi:hypothetical protein
MTLADPSSEFPDIPTTLTSTACNLCAGVLGLYALFLAAGRLQVDT